MVAGDTESGGFYVFDRKQGTFYTLDFEHQQPPQTASGL